ncbi:MAG: dihydrolipoyllysine-residue acetyltransferase, partial [Pseudomonadota bacterium]
MMSLIEIQVPDIGDFDEVAVIELLVKVGDTVQAEQSLITVESDKASMEIPSSHAGVVKEMKVQLGDKVKQGSIVLLLMQEAVSFVGAAEAAKVSDTPAFAAPAAPTKSAPTPPAVPALGKLPHASPSIRKLARELGVPLAEIKGSGMKGRITQEDVQNFTKAVMAGTAQTQAIAAATAAAKASASNDGAGLGLIPWPKVDFAKFGAIERKELGRIQKISGANLLRNAIMIPAVTNHDDADITDLEAFRVQLNKENEKSGNKGTKVTMLAFLIKACVSALKQFPQFNSSLDGDT